MANTYLSGLRKAAKEEFDAKDSGKIAVRIRVRTGDDEDFGESDFVYFDAKKMANDFVEYSNDYEDTFAEILKNNK